MYNLLSDKFSNLTRFVWDWQQLKFISKCLHVLHSTFRRLLLKRLIVKYRLAEKCNIGDNYINN